jgi:hypothetical protein
MRAELEGESSRVQRRSEGQCPVEKAGLFLRGNAEFLDLSLGEQGLRLNKPTTSEVSRKKGLLKLDGAVDDPKFGSVYDSQLSTP